MLFFVKTENKHSKDDKRARERSQSLSFNEPFANPLVIM